MSLSTANLTGQFGSSFVYNETSSLTSIDCTAYSPILCNRLLLHDVIHCYRSLSTSHPTPPHPTPLHIHLPAQGWVLADHTTPAKNLVFIPFVLMQK